MNENKHPVSGENETPIEKRKANRSSGRQHTDVADAYSYFDSKSTPTPPKKDRKRSWIGKIFLLAAIAFGAMMWGAAAMDPQDLQMVMSGQLSAERLPEGVVPPVSG